MSDSYSTEGVQETLVRQLTRDLADVPQEVIRASIEPNRIRELVRATPRTARRFVP